MEMDVEMEKKEKVDFQKTLDPIHHGGLMGKSLDILHQIKQKSAGKQTEQTKKQVEMGSVGTMKTAENDENYKTQETMPIVLKNGIYTIKTELETGAVKIDPAFKALVDSVCHS